MSLKKKYVIVGLGGRSKMYTNAMLGDFSQWCSIVGICDTNPSRVEICNNQIQAKTGKKVKAYLADNFVQMLHETNPDTVIVTSGPDRTHDEYICKSMEYGCDVVTEKPMTIDGVRCSKILKTVEQTQRNLQVAFNYRYSPPRSQVRRLLQQEIIGEILSVDFQWFLDTNHGADYYRRWHRRKENSGTLLVHKATHHFDLINWWLSDVPEEVYAKASLRYYTPQHGDKIGLLNRAERCLECCEKNKCPFYLDIKSTPIMKELYFDCERHDGYYRDRCVFSKEINIWDTMSVMVKYKKGTILNYMLHSYSPYEGYRIAFNGTKGRIEHTCCEKTYVNGDGTTPGELVNGKVSITHIPEFSSPRIIKVDASTGGHGGGDPKLLADIFHPAPDCDPLKRKAGHLDGAFSIWVGIAANKSIETNQPVKIPPLSCVNSQQKGKQTSGFIHV